MPSRTIFNSTPRDLVLSARGKSVIVPKRKLVDQQTPTGIRSGPKRGEVVVDEEFLGALGEDNIVRHWQAAGELDINGPWPKAPPPLVEPKRSESAVEVDRRLKQSEHQFAAMEQQLAGAAVVNDALKAELEKLRAEHAKLLEAATAPPAPKAKASEPNKGG